MVVAHGLTAVREMFLDEYAAAFAAAGYTTLVYDHFGFGASDGEPRQCPAPSIQLEGYRDAVVWLGSQPDVDADRISLWGSSFSGGEVIVLAAEALPIRCAVAQVPAFGEGSPAPSPATVEVMVEAFGSGRDDVTVPAVSATPDGVGIMYADRAWEWFTTTGAPRAPSWRNEVRISAFAEPFRPIDHLANARVPLLLVVAPGDTLTPPGPAMGLAAATPNVAVVEIPGGHFDAYEAAFSESSEAAINWFRRHLTD